MSYRSLLLLLLLSTASAQVAVLSYHNDLARTGQYLAETALTPANVNQKQFGKLFSYALDGQVYAQPLYMPGVAIAGKGTHNVVFTATEHDSVYAFDADNSSGANAAPLWQVSFINPPAGVTTVPYQNALNCTQITPEIGITGTPVIDPASNTLYVVAMTMEVSGGSTNYVHRLHALDLASGAERTGSPVVIQASVPGTGDHSATVTFIPRNYKARPGLLLLNGVVYTSWSSHCDAGTYHGWIMGYDAESLAQVTVYNVTPNGSQASFWAAGAAPAVDADGNMYVISGNGNFNGDTGGPDLGESFLKLTTPGGLAVADYFTPYNQVDLNDKDLDTGSSGALLLPDSVGSDAHPHLLTSAGKEGRIYLVDRDNMGKFQAGSDSQIVQSLPNAIGGMFSTPAYFNGSVYFSGAGDNLKAYSVAKAALSATPTSQSPTKYSGLGSVPSVSANGGTNGIVWTLEGSGSGMLHAYDAGNLANELFNSSQNKARDSLGSYVKFSTPTIANGKVYAGTANSLAVFGLFGPAAVPAGGIVNAASFVAGAVAPGSFIALFGQDLAQTIVTSSTLPLPKSLGGVSLTISGTPAPLYYVSPTQLNAQVPYEAAPGNTTAVLTTGGTALPGVPLTVAAVAPGIFTNASNWALVRNQDGGVNAAENPAPAGSTITVYGTGQGTVTHPVPTGSAAPAAPFSQFPAGATATIGGQTATVSFAGLAPGLVGVFQVNVQVPNLAPGDYPLAITVGGVTSNSAMIGVSAAP